MSKVNYPAVFHYEEGSYWTEFPDLEGCFSNGKTIEEAFEKSTEALLLYLDNKNELFERTIKKPSSVEDIRKRFPDELVMLVECDSLEYGKKYKAKAVKKTLSIPEWLNDLAVMENINFSNVLQEALIEKLKI